MIRLHESTWIIELLFSKTQFLANINLRMSVDAIFTLILLLKKQVINSKQLSMYLYF